MNRIHALDGLRGILAVVVVFHHCVLPAGSDAVSQAANLAVLGFFVTSGYVLARSYDGRPVVFLARRLVRLWPLYAVCMLAGFGLLLRLPPVADLLMWPPMGALNSASVDLPAWSLYLEVWGAPALLVLFWIARRSRGAALAAALASCVAMLANPHFFFVGSFAIGVAATRFEIKWPRRVPALALWLGDVSYSLYLTHWIVIHAFVQAFGRPGIIVAMLAVWPVAWLAWRFVERPSIYLSRRIGANSTPRRASEAVA